MSQAGWAETAKRLMGGYTEEQLSAAFDAVKTEGNWKLPVDAWVGADADQDLIEAAVIFYTGSEPAFIKEQGKLHVQAAGYYAAIGS